MPTGLEAFGAGLVRGATGEIASGLKQREADRRKREREQSIALYYDISQNRNLTPEQQRQARSQIFAQTGQQVPTLKPPDTGLPERTPEETELLEDMMSIRKLPPNDPFRIAVRGMQTSRAMNILLTDDRYAISGDQMTDEDWATLAKYSPMTGAETKAFFEVARGAGATKAQAFDRFTGLSKTKAGTKTAEVQLGQSVTDKVDSGATKLEDFTAAERGWIASEFPTEERRKFFLGLKGDATKVYDYGVKALNDEAAFLFPFGIAQDISLWQQGNLKNTVKVNWLEENVNSVTGEIKGSAAVDKGEAVFKQIQDIHKRLNPDKVAKAIVEVLLQDDSGREIDRKGIQEILDANNSKATVDDVLELLEKSREGVRGN